MLSPILYVTLNGSSYTLCHTTWLPILYIAILGFSDNIFHMYITYCEVFKLLYTPTNGMNEVMCLTEMKKDH